MKVSWWESDTGAPAQELLDDGVASNDTVCCTVFFSRYNYVIVRVKGFNDVLVVPGIVCVGQHEGECEHRTRALRCGKRKTSVMQKNDMHAPLVFAACAPFAHWRRKYAPQQRAVFAITSLFKNGGWGSAHDKRGKYRTE